MVCQKVTVKNLTGLHMRPAGRLCDEARKYESRISFQRGNTTSNAKSLLSILGAQIKCGEEIEFTCEGDDEVEALAAMIAAINSGLGE